MKVNYKEVQVVTQCPFCGKGHSVWVNEMDYLDWSDGALVQNAFPYLSADEREILISGICPTCWDSMFGTSSDEEDWEVPEDEDEDFEDDLDWDYNEDMGFDAYLGCYTDDC